MKQELQDETELRRYILGGLNLAERVQVEKRLFLDDEYLQLAEALEDELIDEYSDLELTNDERKQFESHFLSSPQHRQDLRFARALKRVIASETGELNFRPAPDDVDNPHAFTIARESFLVSLFTRRPVAGFAFAILLIVLAMISWRVYQSSRSGHKQPPLVTRGGSSTNDKRRDENQSDVSNHGGADVNQQQRNNRGERQPSPTSTDHPAPTVVATFTFAPGGIIRGSQQLNVVTISSQKGWLSLRFLLRDEGDYTSYRARLRRDGATIRSWTGLKSQIDQEYGKLVVVNILSTLLSSSRYEVTVQGLASDGRESDLDSYHFQVDKK